jgi:uncharacterized membrane protein
MNPILIHKSDSTIFANVNKFLTFNLETELDLTGWQAKFILGWIEKTIDDISAKNFEIVLGAEDTKQLRLGKQYGTIILTDSNGNIKTVTNTIPFEVTTAVVENEYQEIDLTIPESSGVDIKLKVGASTVTSVNGMTGDVYLDIPSLDGYVKNTDYPTITDAGVIKVSPTYGITTYKGSLIGTRRTLAEYLSADGLSFVSKHALENAKNDFVKRAVTENDIELTAEEKANAKAWLGYAEPTDIMQAIASIPQFSLSIVDELPLAGEKMTLYLVPKEGTNNDVYDEYIWIEQTSSFEHLGTTAVDLTDYVKNTDYATGTKGGVIKISSTHGFGMGGSGVLIGRNMSLEEYNKGLATTVVSKGALDNVLTQYKKCSDPMTEADYNALETKDANTLYLIEE